MSITLKIVRHIVLSAIVTCVFLAPSQYAQAAEPIHAQCTITSSGVITPEMAQGFRAYWSLYSQVAILEGVSPALIAPVHYREHFGRDNPGNGQGIFQLYSLVTSGRADFPSTSGASVSDEEFIRQGRMAVQVLKGKVHERLTVTPEPTLVKQAYYGYNGRNRLYASQARAGEGPWDGSPYVMNMPGVRELIMMTHDGGGGPRRLDPRPGAFPIYEELLRQCSTAAAVAASVPAVAQQASGTGFLGLIDLTQSSGGNSMQEFQANYQPMLFGGEFSLLLVALLTAVGVAYMIHYGKWKRLKEMLVLCTLSMASLSSALMADKFGTGWRFEMFYQNLKSFAGACMKWITYPERVASIKLVMSGMLIAFFLWFSVKCYRSGRRAFGEVISAIKPLFIAAWLIMRRLIGLRHLWLISAAFVTLMFAASSLNTDMWVYGSTTATVVGFGLILWLNRSTLFESSNASA